MKSQGKKKTASAKSAKKSKSAAPKKTASAPRGRRKNAEDTIARVISVATRMFALKGYEGASVKEVCREAKVNVAAVHYHFDSKENLYRAVVEQFGRHSFDAGIRSLQAPRTLDEFRTRLSIFLTEIIESVSDRPELALTIVRDSQTHPELMREILKGTFEPMEKALRAFMTSAIQSGVLDSATDEQTSVLALQVHIHYLISNYRGLKLQYGFDLQNVEHRRGWVEKVLDIYLHGMAARK
jgi:AcrR family transcriptional regulator